MKLLTTLALSMFSILAGPSFAQQAGQMELAYHQPLEGVYSQDWFAQVLGNRDGNGIEVYVVGSGKSGDFFGVISIDCQTPGFSRWLATGGYIPSDRLPREAIGGIRRAACR